VLRVLLTRRWVLLTLLFLALILVMYRLGLWQFHRYQQTNRNNHQVSLVVHAKPVPMGTLSHPGATVPGSQRYRPVTATGHFDAAHQFVVRRRTNADGDIGFFLITPLITTDGKAVLVNRGWVAPNTADGAAFPVLPKTPAGTLTLAGRLQPDETATISGIHNVKGLPPRQFMMISSREQAAKLPEPVIGGYLELVKSSPALSRADSAQTVPAPGANQSTSDEAIVGQGVHLPYAIQWWLFALMVPIGWWILLRQELKDKKKPAAAVAAGTAPPRTPEPATAAPTTAQSPAAQSEAAQSEAAPSSTASTATPPSPSPPKAAAPIDRLSAAQLRQLSMQPVSSGRPEPRKKPPG
jgi:cytochrome oxidase assembly protein ShyY1